MAAAIQRILLDGKPRWAILRNGELTALDSDPAIGLDDLLGMPLADARALVEGSRGIRLAPPDTPASSPVLAPIDSQEVWASGVTYLRSRDGRIEEALDASPYDRVYDAERPELFLKATAHRVVGHGEPVGIRADSDWNVPEAELGLVLNSAGEIFGYLPGNDMSSRSIEGENTLYLPQAKQYYKACAIGPAIVPTWETTGPWDVAMTVDRGGLPVFAGTTSTAEMARTLEDLAEWLFLALDFPVGAILLTGTGIVPHADFTLEPGDTVRIAIAGIGELVNPVVTVGRPKPLGRSAWLLPPVE